MDESVLRDLIGAGIRAPSPDNSQPWRFVLFDDALELRLDTARLGLFFDARECASLIGCGAVLENIRLAASARQLEARWERLRDPDRPERIARIVFAPSDGAPDPLADFVQARCSHRGHFNPFAAIPEQTLRALDASVQVVPGARLYWCRGRAEQRRLRRIVVQADRVRYTHETIHNDFHAKLRWGEDADRLADGLAWDTLGIERPLLPVLRALRSWPLARALNYLGLHHVMAWRGAWVPLVTAGATGVLLVPREVDYVEAGRAFERHWIAVAARGLAYEAFGALPLFLMRLKELGEAGFTPAQVATLRRAEKGLAALVPGYHTGREWLVMIFRIGHAGPPAAYARRRPVESFIDPA